MIKGKNGIATTRYSIIIIIRATQNQKQPNLAHTKHSTLYTYIYLIYHISYIYCYITHIQYTF